MNPPHASNHPVTAALRRVARVALGLGWLAAACGAIEDSRPFIWVREREKPAILAKIAANPWAANVLAGMKSRVATKVASHQTNRDAFLRQLPILWNLPVPVFNAAAGTDAVRNATEDKFNLGVDCSVLYYLTGDEKYARCAADILFNSVQAFVNLPVGTNVAVSGWLFTDDFLLEARVTGTQLPVMYDFLAPYLQTHQVYSVPAGGMVAFSEVNAQDVFRTFYQIARDHGQSGSNWSSLEATCMVNNLLALNDAAERAAALQVYLVSGAARQDSLKTDAAKYAQPGDIWPESLQYSGAVGENDSYLMVLLERYDPGLVLLDTYPNLPLSLSRASYLRYPNGEQISFGDGHRYTEGQPFESYEVVYSHARERGRADLTALFGSLIQGGVAAGEYNRGALAAYDTLGRHTAPLQLLWFAPEVAESGQALVLPRADTLPFAGIALQRNPSADARYGLMAFVGGAAHVHSHASGMSMELYGMGEVLGAKSGRTAYGDTLNENYYRAFASNNTVIVNGASIGEGGWKDLAINTVQVVAMEPKAFATPVSPEISFTCSSFVDNKGTKAEATQQRTLAIIRTSPVSGYYVDVFRSDSSLAAEFHDYIYRNVGSSVVLETAAGALPLAAAPARFLTDAGDPRQQPGWRYFTDTEVSAATGEGVRARFVASLPAGQTYMDLHLPGAAGREYARVTSPPIVDAPGGYATKRAPALVIRQSGEAWKRPFAVVFEPHMGTATSGTVQQVTKLEQAGVVVGLKVESLVGGAAIVQYVLTQPGASDIYQDAAIGLAFKGRFAVVTDYGGSRVHLYLGEGSSLTYNGFGVLSRTTANTQAEVRFVPGQAPAVTSNTPVDVSPFNQVEGTLLSDAADASVFDNGTIDATATTSLLGAGGTSPWVDRSTVYVFQLPNLGIVANPFAGVSFSFNYAAKQNILKNNDLYGLGRRSSAAVVAGDYYGSTTTPDPAATFLQAGILVEGTPLGLIQTSAGGSAALLDYLNHQYAAGAGAGQYVFLRLNTAAVKNGINRATLTMAEGAGSGPPDTRPQIHYTTLAGSPPTISQVADQTMALNSGTGALAVTLGDLESPASSLQLSASSSNTTLVPPGGIVLGGSGANRTVTVTPAAMQTGSATITLSVSDGVLSATDTFSVTVDGFAFLFNQDSNFEGWAANAVVTTPVVAAGALSATLSGNDPQFNRATVLNLSGNHVPIVLVRMKSSAGGSGQLFFSNEVGGISAANSVTFAVAAGSAYQWYAVNVAANANWAGHTIKALRFDPPGTTGTVAIDAILGSNGDFDCDGLPDVWEAANRLDPASPADGLLDSDGDGFSNATEYVLGTHPRVGGSAGSLLAAAKSGSQTTLTFTALAATGPGYDGLTRAYDVQTTTDLTQPATWVGLAGYTQIVGHGQTVTVTQPLTAGRRFYRLLVRMNP